MMRFSIANAVTFTYYESCLVQWAAKQGIDLMGTEGQRTYKRQRWLFLRKRTKTMNSDHLVCCARDIDVVERGRVITDGSHLSYKRLGLYWESINPGCYWGGRWKDKEGKPRDSRHFGYRPKEAA